VLEERPEQPPIELGSDAGLVHDRARRAGRRRVADAGEPRAGRERGAGASQLLEKLPPTNREAHRVSLSVRPPSRGAASAGVAADYGRRAGRVKNGARIPEARVTPLTQT